MSTSICRNLPPSIRSTWNDLSVLDLTWYSTSHGSALEFSCTSFTCCFLELLPCLLVAGTPNVAHFATVVTFSTGRVCGWTCRTCNNSVTDHVCETLLTSRFCETAARTGFCSWQTFSAADSVLRAISMKVRDVSVNRHFCIASLLTCYAAHEPVPESFIEVRFELARCLSSATKSAIDSPTPYCRRWKWKRSAITRGLFLQHHDYVFQRFLLW